MQIASNQSVPKSQEYCYHSISHPYPYHIPTTQIFLSCAALEETLWPFVEQCQRRLQRNTVESCSFTHTQQFSLIQTEDQIQLTLGLKPWIWVSSAQRIAAWIIDWTVLIELWWFHFCCSSFWRTEMMKLLLKEEKHLQLNQPSPGEDSSCNILKTPRTTESLHKHLSFCLKVSKVTEIQFVISKSLLKWLFHSLQWHQCKSLKKEHSPGFTPDTIMHRNPCCYVLLTYLRV